MNKNEWGSPWGSVPIFSQIQFWSMMRKRQIADNVHGIRCGDEIKRFFHVFFGIQDRMVFGALGPRTLEVDELPEHGMSVASVHDGSDDDDLWFTLFF